MAQSMRSVTIRQAIEDIRKSQWVLPAFQRKFVWNEEQIYNLFDSVMRGYPIGACMLWKVGQAASEKHIFYRFLSEYQQWWKTIGEEVKNPPEEDFHAVIDGQQRLTSLYIGYCGTYAVKLKYKQWGLAYVPNTQPATRLYLNLLEDADEETGRKYDFRFFSDAERERREDKEKWFRVGDILGIAGDEEIEGGEADERLSRLVDSNERLSQCSEEERARAKEKCKTLYKRTFAEETICYYEEEEQDLDRVLEIFLRMNGGGTPLRFSDLVMSVLTSRWKEAKDRIDELVKSVYKNTGISLSQSFVLKVFLVLFSDDICFQVKNFEKEGAKPIAKASEEIGKIQSIIYEVCNYVREIGLNDETLRSKYALIPIVYFCYAKGGEINHRQSEEEKENRRKIEIWLKCALLKGMFSGKSDPVLLTIKRQIDRAGDTFPTKEIIAAFKNKAKDITVTWEFVENAVRHTRFGTAEARLLLFLAARFEPESGSNQRYQVDHMYPRSMFAGGKPEQIPAVSSDSELLKFYSDPENWDTLGNLQLLEESENKSKGDKKFSDWAKGVDRGAMRYLIPQDENGEYIVEDDRFKEFVEKRRERLVQAIMESLKE